jgi:hypothetical protein
MLVHTFVERLEELSSQLSLLHRLDLGKPLTMFNEGARINPMANLEEYEEWQTAALHLAASKLYDLEMKLHDLLDYGSDAERGIVQSMQRCVFTSFWRLLLLRDDPARKKAPFPAEIEVPQDFASGLPRDRLGSRAGRLANEEGSGTIKSWTNVIEECLDLCKSAVEALQALKCIVNKLELKSRIESWERVQRSRVLEVN